MKSKFITSLAVLVLGIAGLCSVAAFAQTTDEGPGPSEQPSAPMEMGQQQQGPDQQGPQTPPSDAQPTEAQPGGPTGEAPAQTDQGVARVSLIHGDVSTQRGDSGDWSAAVLNQPLMTADKVSTGDNARTELQLDFANTLRLGANTKANIANLTKKNIQIQIGQGIANYTVSKDSEAEPEIDTPNVSVHPAHHDGVFRIEVHPDGDTVVTVRQGEAQISTPQGAAEIHSGEMADIRGDAASAQYKITSAPDRDDWDQWNSDRDHLIRDAQSWNHTNRYYTGTQDLDAYGQWKNVPDYGNVWVPNEPDGWAPYRNGNWVYQPYYGWTWVGYEPWGWAPYHYGRWLWYGSSWAWWPGPVGPWYRPFWAPAYVSFWGWGGGFGFGVGFGGWGGFGWLPLGPCDWYHPWWGGYRGRFGWAGHGWYGGRWGGFAPLHAGTRFSNVANFRDPHIGGGLSTVNAGHFGAGRVSAAPATRAQLGGARMMAGNLPVMPTRASLSASGRAAAPSTIRNGSQSFFGTHNNVRTASFQQETSNLRQTMQANHVGSIPAGGREGGGAAMARGTTGSSGMERPSAGIANRDSSRETTGNRGMNNSSSQGMRSFTPPSSERSSSQSTERQSMERQNMEPQRGATQSNSANAMSRDGFRPFTPPASSQRNESGAGSSTMSPRGGSSGSYWNRTAPSSSMSSRGYAQSYGRGSSYGSSYGASGYGSSRYGSSGYGSARPQLDMRQPIVRGPSYGGYSRGSSPYGGYGGYRAPSYGGPHSAPSFGGGHSAPSGGGHYSGGGGGHSSGGGHSGGGGHGGGGHR